MIDDIVKSKINIVKTINKSTDEIIPIIIDTPNLDDTLKSTIINVFKFLGNLIELLPDLAYSSNNQANNKYQLLQALDRICSILNQLPENPDQLNDVWFEYNFWWDNYNKIIEKVSVNSPISLSLN